ncbi:MAG: hypothetical protein GY828_08320 [Candidatus Gracilibacteria bacterium]|nr:hypothetical protein [Candidatus Gracilibacteria bacterium]
MKPFNTLESQANNLIKHSEKGFNENGMNSISEKANKIVGLFDMIEQKAAMITGLRNILENPTQEGKELVNTFENEVNNLIMSLTDEQKQKIDSYEQNLIEAENIYIESTQKLVHLLILLNERLLLILNDYGKGRFQQS